MALEIQPNAPQHYEYPRWYNDPEQVENLVTLLEAKTQISLNHQAYWKYSPHQVQKIIFPDSGPNDVEKPYTNAPVPEKFSFNSAIYSLAAGRVKFGPEISTELIARFKKIMSERKDAGSIELYGEAVWDKKARLVAAGLMEFCKLSGPDVGKLLKGKLITKVVPAHMPNIVANWRNRQEFPFEGNSKLPKNGPVVSQFVSDLREELGMTLYDVLDWAEKNNVERSRREYLKYFIEHGLVS